MCRKSISTALSCVKCEFQRRPLEKFGTTQCWHRASTIDLDANDDGVVGALGFLLHFIKRYSNSNPPLLLLLLQIPVCSHISELLLLFSNRAWKGSSMTQLQPERAARKTTYPHRQTCAKMTSIPMPADGFMNARKESNNGLLAIRNWPGCNWKINDWCRLGYHLLWFPFTWGALDKRWWWIMW